MFSICRPDDSIEDLKGQGVTDVKIMIFYRDGVESVLGKWLPAFISCRREEIVLAR